MIVWEILRPSLAEKNSCNGDSIILLFSTNNIIKCKKVISHIIEQLTVITKSDIPIAWKSLYIIRVMNSEPKKSNAKSQWFDV